VKKQKARKFFTRNRLALNEFDSALSPASLRQVIRDLTRMLGAIGDGIDVGQYSPHGLRWLGDILKASEIYYHRELILYQDRMLSAVLRDLTEIYNGRFGGESPTAECNEEVDALFEKYKYTFKVKKNEIQKFHLRPHELRKNSDLKGAKELAAKKLAALANLSPRHLYNIQKLRRTEMATNERLLKAGITGEWFNFYSGERILEVVESLYGPSGKRRRAPN